MSQIYSNLILYRPPPPQMAPQQCHEHWEEPFFVYKGVFSIGYSLLSLIIPFSAPSYTGIPLILPA